MIICPFCGAKNPNGASFCDGCGGALNSAVAAHASAQASAQAQQATAKHQAARQATPLTGTGRLPPRTLLNGRYLVLKTIGQGGMAAVYQASDTRANRTVAIKEMSQDGLSQEELRATLDGFNAEARMLQSLSHENLPKVYDSFSENARHYLVMEFIDGQTLEQRLLAAHGPLSEGAVLTWAAQLCAALDYLHTHNPPIIFRDLKPANIMVTAKDKIKLIDFGIARTFARNRSHDTQALGTPGYAPPEQYGSAQTDARADIYALGATLYQLLTAYDVSKTPFALPPIQTRNPAVSPQVRRAIERATRLDRNQRYTTIREFQNDLLHPTGLYLQSGALARTPAELLALMAAQPVDGVDALYSGRAAAWMIRWKRKDLADAATRAVNSNADRNTGLKTFLASPVASKAGKAAAATSAASAAWPGSAGSASPPPGAGGQGRNSALGPVVGAVATAVGVGVIAAVTSGARGRANSQSAGAPSPLRTGVNAAFTHLANSMTGTSALPAVSPRELDLGSAVAGRVSTGTLTISAQNGVTGVVKSLETWITVNQSQFSGKKTEVTVTVRPGPQARGPQRGAIQLIVPGKSMFIPVLIDVSPPVSPPPPPPPPSAPPKPARGARAAGYSAAPMRTRRRAGRVGRLSPRGMSGIRFLLSVVLAVALAVSAPLALDSVLRVWLKTILTAAYPAAAALLSVGAVVAVVGALAAYIRAPRLAGRARTAILGGLLGGGLAFPLANVVGGALTLPARTFPNLAPIGPLALALPVFVAVGAALGAQSLVNRGLIAIARVIGARLAVALIALALLGATLGMTLLAPLGGRSLWGLGGAVTGGCGLVLGIIAGLLIAPPLGMVARWFANVRP